MNEPTVSQNQLNALGIFDKENNEREARQINVSLNPRGEESSSSSDNEEEVEDKNPREGHSQRVLLTAIAEYKRREDGVNDLTA